jgi:hypothetical protein
VKKRRKAVKMKVVTNLMILIFVCAATASDSLTESEKVIDDAVIIEGVCVFADKRLQCSSVKEKCHKKKSSRHFC